MLQFWRKKKSIKLLKVTVLLGPYLGKTWASMSHAQNQIQDHKLSRIFLFYQNIIFLLSYE